MKSNELRIGNYVYNRNRTNSKTLVTGEYVDILIKIKSIGKYGCNSILYDKIKPIPLTEEWLLKFGFEYNSKEDVFVITLDKGWAYLSICKSDLSISIFDNEDLNGTQHPCFGGDICKHVHQLQNLYFALTGEELTLKEWIWKKNINIAK